jgi:hypothetical protein
MKVTNERVTAPAVVRRASRAPNSAGASAFAAMLSETAVEDSQATTPAQAAAPTDLLLVAQEAQDAPDAAVARRRSVERGHDILDQLDELRLALIAGAVPRRRLERMVELVAHRRTAVADPRLAAVLDEIDLRARIELAKLRHHG